MSSRASDTRWYPGALLTTNYHNKPSNWRFLVLCRVGNKWLVLGDWGLGWQWKDLRTFDESMMGSQLREVSK